MCLEQPGAAEAGPDNQNITELLTVTQELLKRESLPCAAGAYARRGWAARPQAHTIGYLTLGHAGSPTGNHRVIAKNANRLLPHTGNDRALHHPVPATGSTVEMGMNGSGKLPHQQCGVGRVGGNVHQMDKRESQREAEAVEGTLVLFLEVIERLLGKAVALDPCHISGQSTGLHVEEEATRLPLVGLWSQCYSQV